MALPGVTTDGNFPKRGVGGSNPLGDVKNKLQTFYFKDKEPAAFLCGYLGYVKNYIVATILL